MVLTMFGPTVDLHCGGADLAFPHHACEASLAQQATGVTPFARAWLRAGLVSFGGEKMAKSTGNLVLVDELLREHSPAALRLLCLDRPYAQAWDFSAEALAEAETQLECLYSAAGRVDGSAAASAQIADALLDGLDVVRALSVATESGAGARTLIDVLALS
jgi:cysteinyl-tRNA synthetase